LPEWEPTLRLESNSNPQTQRLYLLYHDLRSTEARYSYVIDTAMFQRHVDLYVQIPQASHPILWPELTFDDGHISNLELAAPILQSRNITATFFITVGWTGKKLGYMGWPELRSLHQAGHTIGAHGWTHKLLTHCSDRELQIELNDARLTLEDRLGVSITNMSLPGGRYNHRVLTACEEAGYSEVFTSIPRVESLPLRTLVGRLNILGDMQPEWIAKLFEPNGKLLSDLGKQYRRKETVKKLLGDRLYARLWALVNRKESDTDGAEGAAE